MKGPMNISGVCCDEKKMQKKTGDDTGNTEVSEPVF